MRPLLASLFADRRSALYDRLLRRLTKPIKVKAALKRWLALEKKHGDQAHVDAVIKRAKDYVAGSQGASVAVPAGDEGEASEPDSGSD